MNFIVRLLCLAVLFSFRPAGAQEVEVGTGLICDQQAQAEQFVTAFNGSTALTLEAVNKGGPPACAVLSVAYIRVAEVSTARNREGTYAVTEIIVVGIATQAGIQPLTPAKQYTLFPKKEVEA